MGFSRIASRITIDMCLGRTEENYPLIIIEYPLYLFLCAVSFLIYCHLPLYRFTVNEAGKIAIGVMAGLFMIAGVLLVILLVIRRQRRILKATRSRSALVNEPELPAEATQQRLSRIEESGLEETENMQNSEHSRVSREATPNSLTVHNQFPSRDINQMQMQQIGSDMDRVPFVRFSDILGQQNSGQSSSDGVILSPTVV